MTVHIDPKDAAAIIRATFPDYTGKKVEVRAAEEVFLSNLNWCGGSRNQYAACTLDGKRTGDASAGNAAPPSGNPVEAKTVAVPPGFALVEHCMFCGKDLGLRIYVHPTDMPRYLPASDSELTEKEKKVLYLIRSLISSARREKWRRAGYSAGEYETLVRHLKGKGLLTAQGGLSLAGKNAAAALPLSMRI